MPISGKEGAYLEQRSYLRFVLDRAYAARQPVSGTFELTARCNFQCRMCYIHDRAGAPTEMPTEWWLDLAEQCAESGTLTVLLTGGEPLLRRDFAVIYRRLRELGLLVSINTNASLLTDELLELFAEQKPLRVNASLYGASDETFCALCGVPDMAARVCGNLLALKQRQIDVRLNYTVTTENFDDAKQIYAFADAHDIPVKTATYLFPAIRSGGLYTRPDAATAALHRHDCEQCSAHEAAIREGRARAWEQAQCDEQDILCPPDGYRLSCRAGASSFWVCHDAQLLACGLLPATCRDLREQRFSDAWEGLKKEVAQLRLPPQCACCKLRPYCQMCAASCYAETGSTDGVPAYLCEEAAHYCQLGGIHAVPES